MVTNKLVSNVCVGVVVVVVVVVTVVVVGLRIKIKIRSVFGRFPIKAFLTNNKISFDQS
jgi:hypothetical protein